MRNTIYRHQTTHKVFVYHLACDREHLYTWLIFTCFKYNVSQNRFEIVCIFSHLAFYQPAANHSNSITLVYIIIIILTALIKCLKSFPSSAAAIIINIMNLRLRDAIGTSWILGNLLLNMLRFFSFISFSYFFGFRFGLNIHIHLKLIIVLRACLHFNHLMD